MTAKIMGDNGNEITRTIEKEAAIPDISEYGKRNRFMRYTSFQVFERT